MPDNKEPKLGGYAAKQCRRKIELDQIGVPDERVELPVDFIERMNDGVIFEDELIAAMRRMPGYSKNGPEIAIFQNDRRDSNGERCAKSKLARESRTRKAMRDGVKIIINGRIVVGNRRSDDLTDLGRHNVSEPDMLVRGSKLPSGLWQYLPVDIKHHVALKGTSAARMWKTSELDQIGEYAETRGAAGYTSVIESPGLPHLSDAMQLAHYYRALKAVGHASDDESSIVGGIIGKERHVLWFDVADALWLLPAADGKRARRSALAYYDENFEVAVAITANARAMKSDSTLNSIEKPVWKQECLGCEWREVCRDELEETDHVSLLPGVTPSIANVHETVGITKRRDIARLDHRTATLVDAAIEVDRLIGALNEHDSHEPIEVMVGPRKKREQREAFAAAGIETVGDLAGLDAVTASYASNRSGNIRLGETIDAARVFVANRVHRRRGVPSLSMPRADIEVDIDMENSEIIYMWGATTTVRREGVALGKRHNSYAAEEVINWDNVEDFDSDKAEADNFADFWEWLQTLRSFAKFTGASLCFYCYSAAEERCMRAIVRKNPAHPRMPSMADIDELVADTDLWIDMLQIFRTQTIWPTENMSIKSLAKYARFTWREDDANGGSSVVWYREAVESEDPTVREDAYRRLLSYNEDDTLAMLHLRDWVTKRLISVANPDSKVPDVAVYDTTARFNRRRPKPAIAG